MRFVLLLSFLIYLPWSAQAQTSADSYKIYSVDRKKEIDLKTLVRDLRKADVVFFGEEHDDSTAHDLQLKVFQELHKIHKADMLLSMEMFQSDAQLVLDEYLAGLIRETNLQKDGRLWKNYKDYRPLIEYARENKLYVLAANAPDRYTNRVTREGLESLNVLSDQAKALLAPLPIDTLTGPYYDNFVKLMGEESHESMASLKIYQSQNLWDATMAWRISQLLISKPKGHVLHLNGRFHSDEKLGVYSQLARYAPDLDIVNISSFAHEEFDNPDWSDLSKLGDFVIITRVIEDEAEQTAE